MRVPFWLLGFGPGNRDKGLPEYFFKIVEGICLSVRSALLTKIREDRRLTFSILDPEIAGVLDQSA